MGARIKNARKVTISLPAELVDYADHRADQIGASRSQVIGQALALLRTSEEEELAAEGYRFYSAEAEEFAASSSQAVAEALSGEPGWEWEE
jgi:metal-responsive CopG/Arc/MetJ family transcriptional regulator